MSALKGAYAYKDLLDWSGVLALGTDFPVEDINPFETFYAAVARKSQRVPNRQKACDLSARKCPEPL